mgnify:CR=1 FL=1
MYAKSINGDAFSDEIKEQTLALIKKDLGQVDLIIYSLASPVRTHPKTGVTHRSVLKPIGDVYTNKTVDFHSGKVSEIAIEPGNGDDIENTIAVMGGEQAAKVLLQIEVASLKSKGKEITPEAEKELLSEMINKYNNQTKPEYAAARLWVDAIIDPGETRMLISQCLNAANHKPVIEEFKTGVFQV